MSKIKFLQLLCPSRHLIAAVAFDSDVNTADETKRVMVQSLERNKVNGCGTCKTRDLHFETVETNFNTIAEAGRSVVENNDIGFVEMHKKSKSHDPVHLAPSNRCSRCRKPLDAATGLNAPEPLEGSVSICFYCGNMMIFRADKALRQPEAQELADLKAELRAKQPQVLRMVEQLVLNFIAGKARREN